MKRANFILHFINTDNFISKIAHVVKSKQNRLQFKKKTGTIRLLTSVASTGFVFEIYEHFVIVLNSLFRIVREEFVTYLHVFRI